MKISIWYLNIFLWIRNIICFSKSINFFTPIVNFILILKNNSKIQNLIIIKTFIYHYNLNYSPTQIKFKLVLIHVPSLRFFFLPLLVLPPSLLVFFFPFLLCYNPLPFFFSFSSLTNRPNRVSLLHSFEDGDFSSSYLFFFFFHF